MRDRPTPAGDERVTYRGEAHAVVERPMATESGVETVERVRRVPGVRVLVDDGDSILLVVEADLATGDVAARLPGGPTFDALPEYEAVLHGDGEVLPAAREAAERHLRRETGLLVEDPAHLRTAPCGGSVEWTLDYALATEYGEDPTGADADVETRWLTHATVREWCLTGTITEDRTVTTLLRYLDGDLGEE